MIVILASDLDPASIALATRWAERGAAILTWQDLSSLGWRHFSNSRKKSTAVVQGSIISTTEIEGVLTRLPNVLESDLVTIADFDRAYVAAEMNSFLLSWLSDLKCPVINKPTPNCLCGPSKRQQEWLHAAAEIGIPVISTDYHAGDRSATSSHNAGQHEVIPVNVVGTYSFGNAHDSSKSDALKLAREAGTELLRVWFNGKERGACLLGADLWVDIMDPAVSDAILTRLTEG